MLRILDLFYSEVELVRHSATCGSSRSVENKTHIPSFQPPIYLVNLFTNWLWILMSFFDNLLEFLYCYQISKSLYQNVCQFVQYSARKMKLFKRLNDRPTIYVPSSAPNIFLQFSSNLLIILLTNSIYTLWSAYLRFSF